VTGGHRGGDERSHATGCGEEEVVELPVDGVLDLHTFRPEDARELVNDYLDACKDKGIAEVRIIHGKGKGVLRRIVHAALERRDDVATYRLAGDGSGWGATLVRLSLALLMALIAFGCGGDGGGVAVPDETATTALILADDAEGPEVTSLIGVPLYRPLLSDERRAELAANLDAAADAYRAAPRDEDAIIWYGRRLAYLSRYRDAIAVYSRGLELHPDSYKLLRHRGHRYISTRQLAAAVADLERAAALVEDEPVEIEPDGAPNALGIPLSNVHFNIWYHLGLAYYLQGDFEAARAAYLRCMEYSDNDDLLVATSDWLYMTYRRLGEEEEAAQVLAAIDADMEIIENDSYHRRLLMYRGEVAPEELLDLRADADPDIALNIATQGYGVGNWYLVNGDPEAAREVFERILAGTSWAAFGYIAAEAEVARSAADIARD
jgi:tetratricopeptide (TPR) repeat protein